MSEESFRLQVEALRKDTYENWKVSVHDICTLKGVEDHLEEDKPEPQDPEEKKTWKKDRILARRIMAQSLSNDQLHDLKAAGHDTLKISPKGLWDAIADMMSGGTAESFEMNLRRMVNIKRREFHTLHDLLKELNRIKSEMDASEYKLHEKIHVMCLLTTLHEDYPSQADALRVREKTEKGFTWSELKKHITHLANLEQSGQINRVGAPNTKLSTTSSSSDKKECSHCGNKHFANRKKCTYFHHCHPHPESCYLQFPDKRPADWKLPSKIPKVCKGNKYPPSDIGISTKSPSNTPSPTIGDVGQVGVPSNVYNVKEVPAPPDQSDMVIHDNGSAWHIFNDSKWFAKLHDINNGPVLSGFQGSREQVRQMGDVRLLVRKTDGSMVQLYFTNVAYLPNATNNIVSGQVWKQKGVITDEVHGIYVHRESGREVCAMVYCNGNLAFDLVYPQGTFGVNAISAKLMHQRLMHANMDYVEKICQKERIKLHGARNFRCESCDLAKSTQIIHRQQAQVTTAPLQLVYMDLIDMKPMSLGGANYCLQLIDSYTHYRWVLMLSAKRAGNVLNALKDWKELVEKNTGLQLLAIQYDQAKEFMSNQVLQYFKEQRVVVRNNCVDTHEQNGLIERANRALEEKARAALLSAKLPKFLWIEAFRTAAYIMNRTPTAANKDFMTPLSALHKALNLNDTCQMRHI